MKIILIRHGNKEDGHDGSLTKKGIKQASILSKRLSKIKIDGIYCSKLKRSIQTASILSQKIKIKPIEKPSLNEFEAQMLRVLKNQWEKDDKVRFNELNKFISQITKQKNSEKNIVIVAHGITNRLIISILTKIDYRRLLPFEHHETGISILRWSKKRGNWKVVCINDSSHIPEKLK